MPDLHMTAITGRPVLHSCTPQLYRFLIRKRIASACLRLSAGNAREILSAASSLELKGFNVTAPFKQALLSHLDSLAPEAEKISGANLVVRHKNKWCGYNTDYIGVREALKRNSVSLAGKKVLIAGAGGAARAAAWACQKENAERVTFINRSRSKAKDAARRLHCMYADLQAWPHLAAASDILISCIPGNCVNEVFSGSKYPKIILEADYAHPGLDFLRHRKEYCYISGLEWLIGQGLPSFRRLFELDISGYSHAILLNELARPSGDTKEKIALIGFMGTGKTSTGKELSRLLKQPFIDTDDEIECAAGAAVSEIFQSRGETGFRTLEKNVIPDLIRKPGESVLALGGGAPLISGIKQPLKRYCSVVWLMTPWDTIRPRLALSPRPRLSAQHQGESLESIFIARNSVYAQLADIVIPAQCLSPAAAARRIADEIH